MNRSLILVCDDAGYASVDRGIRTLVEQTGKPVSAEYMIEQPGSVQRAKAMENIDLVSRGLHFELANITDAQRFRLGKKLIAKGSALGEESSIRMRGEADARRQLDIFQNRLGIRPAHISTHGNYNTDAKGNVKEWWKDLMNELFDGDVPPMQLDIPYVRHNLFSWNLPKSARAPRTPSEFAKTLQEKNWSDTLEFVMHPALRAEGDASLDMLFNAEMREKDLSSAIDIIRSGVIEEMGYAIVPVDTLKKRIELPQDPHHPSLASKATFNVTRR